ncbi:MAG: hypothetical protein HYU75_06620 [Betaproteobacteria bacterium]|nr:hypothetical protein [Betaproteobacteria bacterium]
MSPGQYPVERNAVGVVDAAAARQRLQVAGDGAVQVNAGDDTGAADDTFFDLVRHPGADQRHPCKQHQEAREQKSAYQAELGKYVHKRKAEHSSSPGPAEEPNRAGPVGRRSQENMTNGPL